MARAVPGGRDTLEVRGAVTRELSRIFHMVMRVRFFGATLLAAVAVAFIAADEPLWKGAVLGGLALLVSAVAILDLRRAAPVAYTVREVALNLALVLLGQLAIITMTGGIQSPFLLILPVMALILAVATAQARAYLIVMGLVFAAILSLLAVHLLGGAEVLVPSFLLGDPRGYAGDGWVVAAALVLLGVMVTAAIGTLIARRAFEDAIGAASAARAEVVDAARERNRELVSLSGALAHELKNPLASIQGLAGLLRRKLPRDSREGAHINVLLEEVLRMGGILDEFLNFSRPVSRLTLSEVALRPLVAEVALLHEELAEAGGVRLEVARGEDLYARCDRRKIKQVLVNLLQNAIDASPPGGVCRLTIAPAGGGGVRVEVSDEGRGLDDAIRGRLFTAGATTKAAGSGLGLVIARAIAEQHGGALELVERDAGGCRAVLSLPRSPEAEAEAEVGGGRDE